MKYARLSSQQATGLLLVFFGGLLVLRWIFEIGALTRLIPGSAQVGLNTPLLIVAAGFGLMGTPRRRSNGALLNVLATVGTGLLILLPSLVLMQHIFDVNLGVDFVRQPTAPSPGVPHPGRVAPNSCLGFLCAGLALMYARQAPVPRVRPLTMLISLVTLLGVAGLAGHFLRLESLYRVANFNRMQLPTAAAMTVLGMALWMLRDRVRPGAGGSLARHGSRITYRSIVVLTVVAMTGGMAGFAVMRDTFEKSVADSLELTATSNAISLANTIETRLWLPQAIAKRPALGAALAKLGKPDSEAGMRDFMHETAESFLGVGISGVQFLDVSGEVVGSAGLMEGERGDERASVHHPLRTDGQRAQLLWSRGHYLLSTETQVLEAGRVVGSVRTEQRLAIFDKLLEDIRDGNASSDALLCSRDHDDALCAPTRFYAEPFRIPMFKASGEPNLPINRALLGQSAVALATDLRGVQVMAAHTPLQNLGLGLVVKTDMVTLYAPLQKQLNLLGLLLVALVALGTLALRTRVRPLIKQIISEQQRMKLILDNSNDAFIAIGSDDRITDWNREAERTFGWAAAEAIGKHLGGLIVPPAQRHAEHRGFAQFLGSVTEPLRNRRIEVMAVHRDGHEFPVEIAVAALQDARGYAENAFVRDISEPKAAERLLAASEERLRDVTNNIPALVGYFDTEERCQFANAMALHTQGVTAAQAQGMSLREAQGEISYAQHQPHVALVLAGKRTRFEGQVPYNGGQAYFQSHLIPSLADDGRVKGFYLMTFDITRLKEAQIEQARVERRLRAITDNVPALIAQFDREGRMVFANLGCSLAYGQTPEQMMGRTVGDISGADAQLAPYVEQVLKGEAVRFESQLALADGPHFFQQSYVPDFGPDGLVQGFYSVSFDVSDRKQVEQRVAASEKRLRDITDNLPLLISYIDKERYLRFLNRCYKEWMGVDPAEAVNRPMREVIGPTLYEQRRGVLDRALAGEKVSFDVESDTLGVRRYLQSTYIPDQGDDGEIQGVYTVSVDVTALKTIERQLSALARFDTLTGLPNRHQFNERMPEALARAERSGDALALMFLDVDRFKSINDQLGHAAGDSVLKEFAARLLNCVRGTDTVARLAGDEFVIILEGLADAEEAAMVARKIVACVKPPFKVEGKPLAVTTSIGVAVHKGGAISPSELLERADVALYSAKAAGRNTYHLATTAESAHSAEPVPQ